MVTPTPADDGAAIAFGQRILALLDTGSFTTSYKYAVLLALLDAVLESTDADGRPPTVLHARTIGRRVLELYWPQARDFTPAASRGSTRWPPPPRCTRQRRRSGRCPATVVASTSTVGAGAGLCARMPQ